MVIYDSKKYMSTENCFQRHGCYVQLLQSVRIGYVNTII